ncbi:hypothetical protein NBRC111894_4278 [Sporolactobacillus inulinus]|uniref:Uncharacterized protein n=1 Tax=Sporolactobacillus inulinus TaxID=2078 RepID=A0A4Y1ZIG9_9BACL|nr:hypothetical protein NBRC111894_4278 [Sporolactobacillus inulinus]
MDIQKSEYVQVGQEKKHINFIFKLVMKIQNGKKYLIDH